VFNHETLLNLKKAKKQIRCILSRSRTKIQDKISLGGILNMNFFFFELWKKKKAVTTREKTVYKIAKSLDWGKACT